MPVVVIIRGGGDLASGVALRLHRAGFRLVITELPQPLAVRRLVSFAEAIYTGSITIEGVTGRKLQDFDRIVEIGETGEIPVVVDPEMQVLKASSAFIQQDMHVILVDARMMKLPIESKIYPVDLVIGLGPGFVAGVNCDAVIETNRGHFMGRVIWQGASQSDTGFPDSVDGHNEERVLRAPADGILSTQSEIGRLVIKDQSLAEVGGVTVYAPFEGVLRGMLHPGLSVQKGLKIGDIDPRRDPRYCSMVSDKSLAIGGSVLEAILSRSDLRPHFWK